MSRKATLEAELADLAAKLSRAERLVTGLAGERGRWQSAIAALSARLAALPGDAAAAAAFLSYAGPFPAEYREALVREAWLPQVRGKRGQRQPVTAREVDG
jgi:dynein heavy chain